MLSQYYTFEELSNMKLYELPTYIYKAILEDMRKVLGCLSQKLIERFNNCPVFQFDQWVNIYKYIVIIY